MHKEGFHIMSMTEQDMIKAAEHIVEFVQWVAKEHAIDNSAAADLIIRIGETEPDRLALLQERFKNRSSTQLLFDFE
jgi:hypothetical protein